MANKESRKKLFDYNIERACISSSLNFQDDLVDVMPFITDEHFHFGPHKIIFSCIKSYVVSGQKFDVTLLTEKLKTLGLANVESLDMLDYLESLKYADSVNQGSMMQYFQTLHKYYNARSLVETARKIESFVDENIDKTSQELVFGAEKVFAEKVNQYQADDGPQDLVDGLEELVEGLGNEPKEDGLQNPYPRMRAMYGNFLPGGLYIFVAPAKAGKSTLILDILNHVTSLNDNTKALLLDTELTLKEQQMRLVSALSGVNEFYIRTGNYRRDPELLKKVRSIWPTVRKMLKKIDHMYVAGKPIEEIISIARRWYYKNNKEGFTPIVALDYVKLTGEKVSDSWKEYQVIGQKADKLKMLGQELKCPIITAMQTNRTGDEVAMSSQVRWFCSMLAIFRRKTVEELATDGEKWGTHKLTVTESRNLGAEAMGHKDLVQRSDNSWEKMYINFEIENFRVLEKGDLEDIVNSHSDKIDMDKSDEDIPF